MIKRDLPILMVLLLLVSTASAQKETYFFTGFEYGDEPFVIDVADLNGADDQVGEWSGEIPFPETVGGDILEAPDSAGFADNPYGGRLLLIDRPGGDPDTDADFDPSFFADLTEPILLLGAEVSFDVGTRRTAGNFEKDYFIVGRASDGEESFRVRMGTNNNGFERLGVQTESGLIWDLPTIEGDDRPDDLNNTGGFPLGVDDEIGSVKLNLGPESFTIEFAHNEENVTGLANSYVTSALAYNGPGEDLAQLEFIYSGATASGRNSGFVLDNIEVKGFTEILQGDFDFNGMLEFDDFILIAANFGEATPEGDFDFNGVVDLADFIGFKAAFLAANNPAAAAAVPEPASWMLLGIGVVLLGRRRRR